MVNKDSNTVQGFIKNSNNAKKKKKKNSNNVMQGKQVQSLGQEDPLEKEMAT